MSKLVLWKVLSESPTLTPFAREQSATVRRHPKSWWTSGSFGRGITLTSFLNRSNLSSSLGIIGGSRRDVPNGGRDFTFIGTLCGRVIFPETPVSVLQSNWEQGSMTDKYL